MILELVLIMEELHIFRLILQLVQKGEFAKHGGISNITLKAAEHDDLFQPFFK